MNPPENMPGGPGGFPTPGGPGGPFGGVPGGGMPSNQPPPRRPVPADDAMAAKKKKGRGRKGDAPVKAEGGEGDSGPTRRVLSRQRLLAVVLATVAGLLLLVSQGSGGPDLYVVRANAPLSPLSAVSDAQVETVGVSEDIKVDDAFSGETAEEALAAFSEAMTAGSVLKDPVAKGQQLTASMFTLDARLAVDDLGPDERLVSVTARISTAVGGALRPGDRVDVIAATKDLAGVVVDNVEVVSVGPAESAYNSLVNKQSGDEGRNLTPEELLPGSPFPGTYTLRVRAYDAVRLSVIDQGTEVYLAYRSPDSNSLVVAGADLLTTICGKNMISPEVEEGAEPAVLAPGAGSVPRVCEVEPGSAVDDEAEDGSWFETPEDSNEFYEGETTYPSSE